MPVFNDKTAADMAAQYGWALSFLKSDPTLYNVFKQAVVGTWTPDKFVAMLKNTPWWKKNSESVRQYSYLKATDPATFNARLAALTAQVRDAGQAMGANMSNVQLNRVAQNALMFGWNDAQLRDALSGYTKAVNGVYRGAAASNADSLRQTAWRNGINLSGPTLDAWSQSIAAGENTVQYYQDTIRRQAKTLAPGYSSELDAGMDLYDVANAYIQSKAKILELNPADIDLFDKDVRAALSSKDSKGNPTSKSLWQFEQELRQDPRWLKTQNAQDSSMSVGRQVLRDFGFSGV